MSRLCCKYHNNFFQAWIDKGVSQPTDLNDCGMAGRGDAILCCENCPQASFYKPIGAVASPSQRRPVNYILNVIEECERESQD